MSFCCVHFLYIAPVWINGVRMLNLISLIMLIFYLFFRFPSNHDTAYSLPRYDIAIVTVI